MLSVSAAALVTSVGLYLGQRRRYRNYGPGLSDNNLPKNVPSLLLLSAAVSGLGVLILIILLRSHM